MPDKKFERDENGRKRSGVEQKDKKAYLALFPYATIVCIVCRLPKLQFPCPHERQEATDIINHMNLFNVEQFNINQTIHDLMKVRKLRHTILQ